MTTLAYTLFTSFFQIGLCSIGGGYAVIPLISSQVVNIEGWITAREFTDIITISQMTPGPLAVNTSTFVGLRIAGVPGAVAATLGCVLPGLVISLILCAFFDRFRASDRVQNTLDTLRAVSVGLIASAAATILTLIFFPASGTAVSPSLQAGTEAVSSLLSSDAILAAGILAASLWLMRRRHIGPMLIMAGSGLVGIAAYFIV